MLRVPDDYATITEAVDAAVPGDLVLIGPGTYHEAVNVTTDDVTIRGLDRNEVILDGEFELDNGIRILGASGVVVENLTAQNYTSNGVFALETDGYRVSYVTAIRNGDYGIYGFDSVNGTIEHSYAAGSPDAGVYIGQCFPCDSVIDDVTSEHNGLGYSGTNSGGNLYIVNSTFRNNRAGIVPNSGSYELCYPERQTTLVGNIVHSNNQPDTPAIDVALLAMGNGILIPGGVGNVVERNLVYDHEKTGIGLVPFLEEGPNDDLPTEDEWAVDCATQREQELATEVPESLLWESYDNSIRDNVVEASGVADLARGRRERAERRPAQLLVGQRLHHVGADRHRGAGAVRWHRLGRLGGQPARRPVVDRRGRQPPAVGRLQDRRAACAARARGHGRSGERTGRAGPRAARRRHRRHRGAGQARELTCAASSSSGSPPHSSSGRRCGGSGDDAGAERGPTPARRSARRSTRHGSVRRGGSLSSSCSARSATPSTTIRSSTRTSRG